jgi:hypothetical protein
MFETQIERLYNITNQIPKYTYILSVQLDALAIEKFIKPLIMFRKSNVSINTTIKTEYYRTAENSPQRNWILNFPEGAKRALENKMYISFSFSLDRNQMVKFNKKNIFDSNPINTECVYPFSSHAVVITKWEQEAPGMPAYITILNSWGPEWGINGFIRISSENYDKFVLNPSCQNISSNNMQLVYFDVNDDKPFVTTKTVQEIKPEVVLEPDIVVETQSNTGINMNSNPLGGKSKKSKKSKKRKSKKRKSKKRKSKKSRKSKKR